MSLLRWGKIQLHSGGESWWSLDCDDLSDSELAVCAKMISLKNGPFAQAVEPSSHHGSAAPRLASILNQVYATHHIGDGLIAVDDVLTTGASLEELRKELQRQYPNADAVRGYVIFARGDCPDWITPIFRLTI